MSQLKGRRPRSAGRPCGVAITISYVSIRYTRTAVSWKAAARSDAEYPSDSRLKALYITL